jgi:hypothetical protein
MVSVNRTCRLHGDSQKVSKFSLTSMQSESYVDNFYVSSVSLCVVEWAFLFVLGDEPNQRGLLPKENKCQVCPPKLIR